MTPFTKTIAAGAFALGAMTAQAQAQDVYFGLTYGNAIPHSGGNHDKMSLLGGVLMGQSNITYGGEVEFSVADSAGTEATSRLRGIVHNELGTIGTFATLGISNYGLEGGGSAEGFNYGLGVDYAITNRIDVRLEAMRDILWGEDPVTSIRAGVTYGF